MAPLFYVQYETCFAVPVLTPERPDRQFILGGTEPYISSIIPCAGEVTMSKRIARGSFAYCFCRAFSFTIAFPLGL